MAVAMRMAASEERESGPRVSTVPDAHDGIVIIFRLVLFDLRHT
jgi:hypothetical protein